MFRKIFVIFSVLFCTFLFADVPREQIERELDQSERDFQIARKMFNPWYGGPLLTGSGNVMSPGYININPSIQITDNYAIYSDGGHSHTTDDLINVNPVLSLGFGLFDRVDSTFKIQTITQKQNFHDYTNLGDASITIALAILKETPYIPALKVSVKEIFPTGNYKKFNPDKSSVQSTGGGAYKTEFGLGFSKIVWWSLPHPMQLRLSLNYGFSTKAKVENFNTYGGGYGTSGKAQPGSHFNGSFGYEFSVMQKFVLAFDLAYERFPKTMFKGILGTNSDGSVASVGGPRSDVLSFAPAVEFVFTPDIALVTGLWFSIWGRNTLDFIAVMINFSYGF